MSTVHLFSVSHGRLAKWIKWRACDVGEAKERLEIELWRRRSNGRVGEWAVSRAHSSNFPSLYLRHNSFSNPSVVKQRNGCKMSFDLRGAAEGSENDLWRRWSDARHKSFSKPSTASPTSQLILQHIRCFTYITGTSPTSPGEQPMMCQLLLMEFLLNWCVLLSDIWWFFKLLCLILFILMSYCLLILCHCFKFSSNSILLFVLLSNHW